MKFVNLAIAAHLIGMAIGADFAPVDLEAPLNWLAGSYLFPEEMIAGYHGSVESSNYTAETWGAYVLSKCKTFTACTSAISYQGTNSGSTGGRYWFGEVFRGGPTNESFYVRDTDTNSNVTNSIAWTVVE